MAYDKQEWKNGKDGGTPVSAKRLNHIEDGIAAKADKGDKGDPGFGTEEQYDAIIDRLDDLEADVSDLKADDGDGDDGEA